ncbi:MAG TPA: SDR family oxidoreductase [Bryobacteraceae bacterium]|jgi:short-subunit dehydrogenase|nr:SDR family oxidoreductase [Bryobacteraceae bacterium]
MNIKLKPISDQTIVITGASSGIGLATARMAVNRGARVVVAARAQRALETLENELNREGKHAVHVAADVTSRDDVHRIAETAMNTFGGFDTWVNDAGTSVYGRITEVPVDDERSLFDVNFWGAVYGMKEAVAHLRKKSGALINVGSEVSDHAIPLQGAYSASKHALKAYTDALRIEIEKEKLPISVTLIKPTGIATPFFEHAKNYTDAEPIAPPPVYAPEVVAEAILYAAETPTRDFLVGESAVINSVLGRLAPGLNDKVMKVAGFKGQQDTSRTPGPHDHEALEKPSGTLKERGDYNVTVMEASPHNVIAMHPRWTMAMAAAAGVALVTALRRR